MKIHMLRVFLVSAVVGSVAIGCSAQCDPMKDPNQCLYGGLPGMPTPPPATDMTPLSTETAIQTAFNIAKGAQKDPSGEVMDVAIAAISVGYPPAGAVLGILKGLFDSGGADPVGEAIAAINKRIDNLQTELTQLQGAVNQIQDQQFHDENLARTRLLLDRKGEIQHNASLMSTKPDDKQMVTLLGDIQRTADRFLSDPDLWQWSDLHVKSDNTGVHVKGMNPDFKAYPAFEAYSHALVLWMSALQYASKGNERFFTTNKNLQQALLRHAGFLSVRPNFEDGTGCSDRYQGGCPKTLAEQVLARSACSLAQVHGPDRRSMCTAQIVCSDQQRHLLWKSAKYPGLISFMSENQPGEACALSGGPLEEARAELLNQYGVDIMQHLARQLQNLARYGAASDQQYVGQFDMTFYTQQFLYGIKPNGELLMYQHQVGVDKNPPKPPQQASACSSNVRAVCAAMASSTLKLASASAAAPNSRLATAMRVDALKPATPRVIHKWTGPFIVGSGWQQFRQVIPAGSGNAPVQTPKGTVMAGGLTFYAVANDGSLLWYRQNTIPDDKAAGGNSYQWAGPIKVASGFNAYKQIFSGGEGVIYAIGGDGSLNQYRFNDFADVKTLSTAPVIRGGSNRINMGTAKPYQGPDRIATGWGNYIHVFSSGEGIIYAVTPDGRLLWFRDLQASGQKSLWRFAAPRQVGIGWQNMKRIFSPGDGVIYAINNAGEVFWYKHDGYQDGTPRWEGPTKIASDWGTFLQVFPWMPTATKPGSDVH